MDNKIKNVFIFASGVAVGSMVTWKLLESKYRTIAEEEIESVRELYSNKDDCEEEESVTYAEVAKSEEKENIVKYVSRVSDLGYSEDEEYEEEEIEEPKKESAINKPFVISPNEFGENEDYDQIYLTYYSGDDFLANEDDELVEDVADKIGWESLNHFGDYEDDIVHVQNDELKCYYEITVDNRNYREVVGDL